MKTMGSESVNEAQAGSAENGGAGSSLRRRQAAIAIVVLGALILISVLGLLRVPHTTVALDIRVSEVGFLSTAQQPLTDRFRISYLGVISLHGTVDLPRSRTRSSATYTDASLFLWAEDGDEAGYVTLREIVVPDSASISLRHATFQSPYRLTIRGTIAELTLNVRGPVHLSIPGEMDERLQFDRAGTVTFVPAADTIVIEFTLGGPMPARFFPQLHAANLDLTRLEVFRLDTLSVDRRVSSIHAGAIRFESLRGEQSQIHAGQWLEFDRSEGVVRQLDLTDDLIELSFVGEVQGMKAGARQVRRNLMPTVLEWLMARQTLGLLWGTVFALIGLLGTAAKLWR
jgi:hypothetical protein